MEFQHINVKLFVDGELNVDPAKFIDVFHVWVKDQVFDGLLIDVADYRHVPAGPGILLVGLEGDFAMDHTDARWGLRYNRKAPLAGSNADRFRQALSAAVEAGLRLQDQFAVDGPLTFDPTAFELFVNDRALAPNTAETFAAFKPEIDGFLSGALGHGAFTLNHRDNPRSRFGVYVKLAKPLDWQTLGKALTFPA
jgi:hypothetical protein